jgi:hypothetical protein
MKKIIVGMSILSCLLMNGCLSVGTDSNPPQIKTSGIIDSYIAISGFKKYENLISVDVFSGDNQRWGSILSVEVWPLLGVGCSFVGAKVKVFPFEIGIGTLGYHPRPDGFSTYTSPDIEKEMNKMGYKLVDENNDAKELSDKNRSDDKTNESKVKKSDNSAKDKFLKEKVSNLGYILIGENGN